MSYNIEYLVDSSIYTFIVCVRTYNIRDIRYSAKPVLLSKNIELIRPTKTMLRHTYLDGSLR